MSKRKQKQKPAEQLAHPQQHYRGKDVTGALAFVQTLMDPDAWAGMGEEQPKTDREAARFFFEIDRSNATMDEFLAHLKAFAVAELDRLSRAKRIPPKRLVGFVNMQTGEKRAAFPDFITLQPEAYAELLHIVRWVELKPDGIDLPDGAWEPINDRIVDLIPLDEAQWPGVFVDSVQVETPDTMERGITPGTLVVLLQHQDDAESTEHHCVLVCGKE